jgi:hypothetical protein
VQNQLSKVHRSTISSHRGTIIRSYGALKTVHRTLFSRRRLSGGDSAALVILRTAHKNHREAPIMKHRKAHIKMRPTAATAESLLREEGGAKRRMMDTLCAKPA